MVEEEIRAALGEIPLSGLRFFGTIGSTNDEASAWAAAGATDLSLVIADEQTAGRGRAGSRWFTPAGTALAFSLVLRPQGITAPHATRVAGLGALAVVESCTQLGLEPAIKWPNDILLAGRKVGGVLVESMWSGEALEASILGVGVNVLPGAVPPADQLSYPATSIESELGRPVDRVELLKQILQALVWWRGRIATDEFIKAWESRLAFRGQRVTLKNREQVPLTGILSGLAPDGSARIEVDGKTLTVQSGEVHLRTTDDRIV